MASHNLLTVVCFALLEKNRYNFWIKLYSFLNEYDLSTGKSLFKKHEWIDRNKTNSSERAIGTF